MPVTPRVTPRLTLSAAIHKISKIGQAPALPDLRARASSSDTGSQACGGDVLIDVKVKTVRTILRQTKVNSDCTFARKFDFSGLADQAAAAGEVEAALPRRRPLQRDEGDQADPEDRRRAGKQVAASTAITGSSGAR